MKRKVIAIVLVLAVLLCLGACGKDAPSSADEGKTPSSSAETYIFTDSAGREVEVSSNIERIVPSSALSQMILLAIAPEKLVGLASEPYEPARGILPEYLFDLLVFGNLYADADLNIEELALADPQLVIDMGRPQESTKEDMNALQEQTLIPSVYIAASLETMPETFRTLGKLLGKEEKAEQLAQFCEETYARTLSIMEQVGDNKVDCLYVLGEEGLNVIATNSYHAELMDLLTNNLAVVENPMSKGSGNEVTMEQISLWNPEFVIFAPDSIYGEVKEKSPWNQVDAIVNNNYVEVPDAPHNWMSMPPSVQRYLGLIWLTAELYPEYCDYDVKEEILEYYELFYGCSLTEEQYADITANAFRK